MNALTRRSRPELSLAVLIEAVTDALGLVAFMAACWAALWAVQHSSDVAYWLRMLGR